MDKASVSVAVAGSVAISDELLPGRNYYGDHLGKLVAGEYVGLMNTESYYVYVDADGKILSDDNRVGFALDSHTLYLKVNNFYVCLRTMISPI